MEGCALSFTHRNHRPFATRSDSDFTLTIENVPARYAASSISRTPRCVQRYCAKRWPLRPKAPNEIQEDAFSAVRKTAVLRTVHSQTSKNMAKSARKTTSPTIVKRTVMPVRRKNADLRTREYLTDDEVQSLCETAKANRHGHRDATMILVAYRHGLRASELTDLRKWAR